MVLTRIFGGLKSKNSVGSVRRQRRLVVGIVRLVYPCDIKKNIKYVNFLRLCTLTGGSTLRYLVIERLLRSVVLGIVLPLMSHSGVNRTSKGELETKHNLIFYESFFFCLF